MTDKLKKDQLIMSTLEKLTIGMKITRITYRKCFE